MKNVFTILMHAGRYVDEKNLSRGIYATSVPVLHPEDETISKMEGRMLDVARTSSSLHEGVKSHVENLKKCELVKYYVGERVDSPVGTEEMPMIDAGNSPESPVGANEESPAGNMTGDENQENEGVSSYIKDDE